MTYHCLPKLTRYPRFCDLMSRKRLAYLFAGIGPWKGSKAEWGDSRGEGAFGMEEFARAVADFVRDHQACAAPVVLLLAFGESLAFISLLVPAWGALVAI